MSRFESQSVYVSVDEQLIKLRGYKGFQPLGLFHDAHLEEYFLCCSLAIQDHLLHVHTKQTQVELTTINRKKSYHILNIYSQQLKS